MDIQIFYALMTFATILTIVGFFFQGNIGIVCGFIAGALYVLTALQIGSGIPLTTTIYFDPTTSVVQNIDLGISTDNLMILLLLIGIYDFFIGFKSLKVF